MACFLPQVAIFPECATTLEFNVGLTPGVTYAYLIVSPRGTHYKGVVTAEPSGALLIDQGIFPVGAFNKSAGVYFLNIYETNDMCQPVLLTYCGEQTEVIVFRAEKIITTSTQES